LEYFLVDIKIENAGTGWAFISDKQKGLGNAIKVMMPFHVNLNTHTCSCRKWQLCGLPCAHAMAAISKMQRSVYDYVHALYKRPAYDRSYQRYISPMSSSDLWPRTQHRPLKPPAYVKQPGRPKKKRIEEVGEVPKGATKLPRYDVDVHCGKCGAEGHNRKSCSQVIYNYVIPIISKLWFLKYTFSFIQF
jgi:hypothetical protein